MVAVVSATTGAPPFCALRLKRLSLRGAVPYMRFEAPAWAPRSRTETGGSGDRVQARLLWGKTGPYKVSSSSRTTTIMAPQRAAFCTCTARYYSYNKSSSRRRARDLDTFRPGFELLMMWGELCSFQFFEKGVHTSTFFGGRVASEGVSWHRPVSLLCCLFPRFIPARRAAPTV